MKLINKPVVLLVFSLVLLLSIGSVCASDDIGVSDIDNSDLGVSSLSEVPVDDGGNVNGVGANPGSFSDNQINVKWKKTSLIRSGCYWLMIILCIGGG